MSSEEKKRREEYKRKRTMWILIESALVAVVFVLLGASFLLYNHYNQDYYYEYTEVSNVDYKVYINDSSYDDDFYKVNGYLPANREYIADIIDYLEVDFIYQLKMDESSANYNYSYSVDAYLEVVDTQTSNNNLLYKHTNSSDPINVSEKNLTTNGNSLSLNKKVTIDYDYYNNKAKEYLTLYNPTRAQANLYVKFTVNANISCDEFATNNNNSTITLRLPLDVTNVKVEKQGIGDANENKVLVSNDVISLKTFETLTYSLAIAEVVLILVLVIYVFASRNTDINYEIKVKRIMNGYKSFIQKILNKFNFEGFQILYLSTIEELLDIRDTLQMPVLMYENEDKTCTQFMLPTTNNVLYMVEIKVDNYDELYKEKVEEKIAEPVQTTQEELVLSEETVEPENTVVLEEETHQVDTEEATDSETDNAIGIIRYNYSFEARLSLSKEEYRNFYLEIAKFAKEYGVNVVRSWDRERIYLGRKLFSSLQFKGKTLYAAFPVDPKDASYEKFEFMDFSDKKRYQQYPAVIKVTSKRKVKYVKLMLEKLFIDNQVKNKNLTVEDEIIVQKTKEELIEKGLVKVN